MFVNRNLILADNRGQKIDSLSYAAVPLVLGLLDRVTGAAAVRDRDTFREQEVDAQTTSA